MKILMISPVPTHPPTAGNRARILTLAQGLIDAGHELHFAWIPTEPGDTRGMTGFFEGRFHDLGYRSPGARASRLAGWWRRGLRALKQPAAYVWGVDDWYDEAATEALMRLDGQHRFDAVFVEYVFMSKAFEAFGERTIKILDTHDRFADRHLAYLKAGKRPDWFATTPAEEVRGLRRADVVLAIQDGEAEIFSRMLSGAASVLTVGHLLDIQDLGSDARRKAAVFVASGNAINVDAANVFVTQVLPRVRDAHADFEVVLAGDVCARVPDAPGVRKLGRVDSIPDTYRQGLLAINPVRMGTGLNIKTVECLALGMPLVATESGSRGLESLRNVAMLTVGNDDYEGMAQAVIAVLDDSALRTRLSQEATRAAREWNAEQLSNLDAALGLSARRAA